MSDKVNVSSSRLGQSAFRTEDLSLLTGSGRYADDLPVAIGAHGVAFLRSPHAHAKINSIDTSEALKLQGVESVITGEQLATMTKPFIVGVRISADQFALAVRRVRYAGEAVCMVVATDRYVAEDAIDLISVDYTPLPTVVDPEIAASKQAPKLFEVMDSNIAHERKFTYGKPDTAFANAKHVISTRVEYPRNSCTPIECFYVSASYNGFEDSYEVTANFQGPFTVHPVMARALGVSGNKLRLKTPPDSGGSYGVKQGIFPYIVACCIAARVSGKPVRWVEDRLEHLAAATSATNRVVNIEAAINEKGIITALRFDQLEDCGGYLRAPEPATLYRMHGNLNGAYDIRNIDLRNRVVLTNKTPTGLVRGFGGPQLYFAIERLIDKIALTLDIDPIELRLRNFVPSKKMPYRTASGALLDSGDYTKSTRRAVDEGGYAELKARKAAALAEGRIYGIGCAAVVEPSISNMGYISTLLSPEARKRSGPKNGALTTATVAFDPSGAITVNTASVPQGQGHRTVLAQVVADVFDIDYTDIVVSTDHDTVKDSWSIASGNYSSRFAGAVAGAAHLAAHKLREKIAHMAAEQLNVATKNIIFKNGFVIAKGNSDNAIKLSRIAGSMHWSSLSMPKGIEKGLRETVIWTMPELTEPDENDLINSSGAYGFIFDLCGVEIDRDTGEVIIDKYVTMHDAGKILHPDLANGQIRGAFAQGLGAALMEEFSYSNDGAFVTGTLADYLIPTACEVPDITILHDETHSPFTPLGAKGIGEGNCMSTPVCIANAVSDALGLENIRLPLYRSKISGLIHKQEVQSSKPSLVTPAVPLGDGRGVTGIGSILVDAPIGDVWNLILDEEALAKVIPGCHELDQVAPNNYKAVMTIGVGPIKGKFNVAVALKDLIEPTALRLVGSASGTLGESQGEGQINLKAVEEMKTEISYQYAVLISGKAASIGGRMLDGATRSFINLFFAQLTSQLGVKPSNNVILNIWHMIRKVFGGSQ